MNLFKPPRPPAIGTLPPPPRQEDAPVQAAGAAALARRRRARGFRSTILRQLAVPERETLGS